MEPDTTMQIASHLSCHEAMVRNLLSMLTGKGGWSGSERDGSVRSESGCILE